MNILHLTIKKKFYDMIASGEKLEEYRSIKPYWISRLITYNDEMEKGIWDELCDDLKYIYKHHGTIEELLDFFCCQFKKFEAVEFKNGYGKVSPSMIVEFKGLDIGEARPEWSDNWKGDVFRIKLGKILNITNND